MRLSAPFSVLFFACAAHSFHHVLLALYFTLVLAIAPAWHLPYNTLIALWTIGAMLVGLGSPIAGWLADRIGETKVLVLCFGGLGAAAMLCGLARNTAQLQAALALLGLSGSIYHPVGFAWVVKHARVRGRAIAATGFAGSVGVALGPVVAAGLASLWGWRAAFILPGAITVAAGIALLGFHLAGRVEDRAEDRVPHPHTATRADMTRVFSVMSITMTLTLMVYAAFGTALPKLIQLSGMVGPNGLFAIGLIAGTIQFVGATAQFLGGRLADGGALKLAYSGMFILMAAIFPVLAFSSGWAVGFVAVAAVLVFEATAPLETIWIAHYTPASRRGFVFGMRYALGAIGTPAGVWLVARSFTPEHHFTYMLMAMTVLALIAMAAALFLPGDRAAQAVPAE